MIVMCVNKLRTVGSIFSSLGGFFPPACIYAQARASLSFVLAYFVNITSSCCAPKISLGVCGVHLKP